MTAPGNQAQSPLTQLLIAIAGVYGSFIYYGILQEKLFKSDYSGDGNKFKFAWATLFLQGILSFLLAGAINRFYYNLKQSALPFKLQFQVALFYSLSMFGSNAALKYISYPIQALMKSSKIISVMLISAVSGTEKFSKIQYVSATVITLGIIIFNVFDSGKKGKETQTTVIGLALILLSLFSDGMTGSKQNEARKKYNPSAFDMMEACNKVAWVLALVYALLSAELFPALAYMTKYPACIADLLLLGFMGTIGQCFVYYTVTNFGPFYLSVITTTRKFFTVIFSIFLFGHSISIYQWLSIGFVFFGVGMEMYEGKQKHDHEKNKKKKADLDPESPEIMLNTPTKKEVPHALSSVLERENKRLISV
jgi:UDP-galactose transporter B1